IATKQLALRTGSSSGHMDPSLRFGISEKSSILLLPAAKPHTDGALRAPEKTPTTALVTFRRTWNEGRYARSRSRRATSAWRSAFRATPPARPQPACRRGPAIAPTPDLLRPDSGRALDCSL